MSSLLEELLAYISVLWEDFVFGITQDQHTVSKNTMEISKHYKIINLNLLYLFLYIKIFCVKIAKLARKIQVS